MQIIAIVTPSKIPDACGGTPVSQSWDPESRCYLRCDSASDTHISGLPAALALRFRVYSIRKSLLYVIGYQGAQSLERSYQRERHQGARGSFCFHFLARLVDGGDLHRHQAVSPGDAAAVPDSAAVGLRVWRAGRHGLG